MVFIIIGLAIIIITGFSIEGKLRENNELNKEIIELLKQDREM